MDENSQDESVSKLLRTWQLREGLPPRFQENVWSRIEQAERTRSVSFWQELSSWMNGLFARPAIAVTYVATLLVAGIGAGHLKSNIEEGQIRQELTARYVQSVDPYAKLEH